MPASGQAAREQGQLLAADRAHAFPAAPNIPLLVTAGRRNFFNSLFAAAVGLLIPFITCG